MDPRCIFGRHAWKDHEGFERMNAERRVARGDPLVRECERCGRVESAAFTGTWKRAEHLER